MTDFQIFCLIFRWFHEQIFVVFSVFHIFFLGWRQAIERTCRLSIYSRGALLPFFFFFCVLQLAIAPLLLFSTISVFSRFSSHNIWTHMCKICGRPLEGSHFPSYIFFFLFIGCFHPWNDFTSRNFNDTIIKDFDRL